MRSRSHSGGVVHVSPLISHSFTYRKRACKRKTCILSSCLCVGCLIRKRNIFFSLRIRWYRIFIYLFLFGYLVSTMPQNMQACDPNSSLSRYVFPISGWPHDAIPATWCNTCTVQVWGLPVNTLKPTKRLGLGLRGESVRGAKRCKWVKSVVEPWCNQMLILLFSPIFFTK